MELRDIKTEMSKPDFAENEDEIPIRRETVHLEKQHMHDPKSTNAGCKT